VDANGGLHGAIFELNKQPAENLLNQLASKGAQVSAKDAESTKQAAEAASENK
jgi:hypothetical protein